MDRIPVKDRKTNGMNNLQCLRDGTAYYKRSNLAVNWTTARTRCRKDNEQLVVIESYAELELMAAFAAEDGSWIGAKRENESFIWIDGSSMHLDESSEFWNIGHSGSLSNTNSCVFIDPRGPKQNLQYADCDVGQLSFICNYESKEMECNDIVNPKNEKGESHLIHSIEECRTHEIEQDKEIQNKIYVLGDDRVLCPSRFS